MYRIGSQDTICANGNLVNNPLFQPYKEQNKGKMYRIESQDTDCAW